MKYLHKRSGYTYTKVGYVGEAILASVALVGVVSVFALFPGAVYIIAPFIKKTKYKSRQPRKQTIEKSVESLLRSGLIQQSVGSDGDVKIELTARGKWHALLHTNSHEIRTKKKWDGMWRVIIFDVPISKNRLRVELRKAMRMFGFKMLQRSVWVYPYQCDDFVEILKSHLGIAPDVLYMKVAYIENDKNLRSEFHL